MSKFSHGPSILRSQWFDNFREYLDVTPLGYSNTKESGDYSEEIVLGEMKYLPPSVKTWLIECALEMISSDLESDYIEDVRVTASRISKALDIPEEKFYDAMSSQTAKFDVEMNNQKVGLNSKKTIQYSKYKTSGLFFSNGDTKIEIFEDDTLTLTTPEGQKVVYQIETLFEDRNDRVIVLRNTQGGLVGEFRMQPLGKAEIKFPGRNVLKLKI
jgi:hypothetical protein